MHLLHQDGLDIDAARYAPRRLTQHDLDTAAREIAPDCDLTSFVLCSMSVEWWNDSQ